MSTDIGEEDIFGTADDLDRDFGVDDHASISPGGAAEPFRGRHDTLNTIAFGLATGRK